MAPSLDLDEVRDERERAFVVALHARAVRDGWQAMAWPADDRLTFAVDVCPPGEAFVARMLRVDFFGDAVQLGPDTTFQLAEELRTPRIGGPPEVLAGEAADWIERELARGIAHEVRGDKEEWYLTDTGERLVWRAR